MKHRYDLNSPYRLFALIIIIVFIAELLVMSILHYLNISMWYSDFIDAFSLVLLLVPSIYFFLIRPLVEKNAAFKTSEERLRAITSHIPEGLITIDTKGIIQNVNVAACQMFDYHQDELLQKNVSMLMPSPYCDQHDMYLARYLETGEKKVIGRLREVEGYANKGKIINIELQVTSLKIGGQTFFMGLLRDISERKQLEAEYHAMRMQVEQTQRLESLGVLAGGIAHDFNNILTSIMGNATLAHMKLAKDSPAHERLDKITIASHQAAELCKQMLAYAGKGQLSVSECHLSHVIKSMQTQISALIAPEIELSMHLSDDLSLISADSKQLQQLIMNLLLNANEAIGDKKNGSIQITTSYQTLDEEEASHCLGYQKARKNHWHSHFICISINDNGGGVDPNIMDHLFEPFFTTRFMGRGLGLSACLGIMRSLNGLIQVKNKPNQGLCISAFFPYQQTNSMGHEHAPLTPLGRILLADGDPIGLRVMLGLLYRLGLDVITASDGQKAVSLFQEQENIDLVILELSLFKIAGTEALDLMRQKNPNIKIIFISSYNENNNNRILAHSLNAAFLLKPIEQKTLLHTLSSFCNKKKTPKDL